MSMKILPSPCSRVQGVEVMGLDKVEHHLNRSYSEVVWAHKQHMHPESLH